jgi:ERCC4-type nuclease
VIERLGLKCEVTELEYGDFAFEGRGERGTAFIGIERKTIGDLLSSIQSGRFSGHQLIGMLEMYDYQYLLVEGAYRPSQNGILEEFVPRLKAWKEVSHGKRIYTYAEVDRWLGTIEVHTPVIVRRAYGIYETAHMVKGMYHRWRSKEWDEHRSHLAFVEPSRRGGGGAISFRKPTLVQCVAKELPGVGWDRSKAIAKHFQTVVEMVNADEKEWMEIEGIGKGMATKIQEALRSNK